MMAQDRDQDTCQLQRIKSHTEGSTPWGPWYAKHVRPWLDDASSESAKEHRLHRDHFSGIPGPFNLPKLLLWVAPLALGFLLLLTLSQVLSTACSPGGITTCFLGSFGGWQGFAGPAMHEFSLNSKAVSRLVVVGEDRLSGRKGKQGDMGVAAFLAELEPGVPNATMAPMKDMPPWFRPVAVGRHVPDRRPVRALRYLMSHVAVNNTVIILSTNSGFFKLTLNLLCRLRDLGVTNVLVWALDRESADALGELGVPYYFDSSVFAVSRYTSYFDPEYIQMMVERPAVWWRMLATGFDLLFLDSDVVLFKNPMEAFPKVADVEGQIDARQWREAEQVVEIPQMCAGAFWIKSNPKTLRFLDQMGAAIQWHALSKRYDDQYALNTIIRDSKKAVVLNKGRFAGISLTEEEVQGRLTVFFVGSEAVLGGKLEKSASREVGKGNAYNVTFVYRSKAIGQDREQRVRPAIFHLNGRGLEYIKLKMMKKAGWWEVMDDGQCRSRAASAKRT